MAEDNYKRLRAELDGKLKADSRLKSIAAKISAGTADFKDTSEYTQIVARYMGEVISSNIGSITNPLGKEMVCKALLRDEYESINGVLGEVQTSIDDKLGIHIKPVKPAFPTERVDKAAHSLEDPTVTESTIKRRARSTSENITNSFHDDYIRENARFRSKAGLKCYITRETDGKCCPWCSGIAGRYEYGTEPHDIYRRHDNCGCTVTYENGRQRQDVWSKRTWEAPEPNAGAEPPKVFSKEEAKELENSLTNEDVNGIIKDKKITSADEEYNSVLLEKYNRGTDTAKAVYDKYIPYDKTVEDYHYPKSPYHSAQSHKVYLNVDEDQNNPRGAGTTWFHEHGHYVDCEKNYFSCNDDYLKAIRHDVKSLEASMKAVGYRSTSDVRLAIGSHLVSLGDVSHSIQDIFGGAIGKPYPGAKWAHQKNYWNRSGRYGVCKEAFAHMFEASFTPEKAELMKQYLPNAWAQFEKMLGGLV